MMCAKLFFCVYRYVHLIVVFFHASQTAVDENPQGGILPIKKCPRRFLMGKG